MMYIYFKMIFKGDNHYIEEQKFKGRLKDIAFRRPEISAKPRKTPIKAQKAVIPAYAGVTVVLYVQAFEGILQRSRPLNT